MRIIKPVEFDPSEGNFSRASTGTYFDKDGVLRTAAVDEPRWNYTYEDGEWVGPELLVEEQRTNLLTYSEDFGNAAWQKSAAQYVVAPNADRAPDGVHSASAFIVQPGVSAFNTGTPTQAVSKAPQAVQYTLSAFVKAKGATTSVRVVPYGADTANSAAGVFSLVDGTLSATATAGAFSGVSGTAVTVGGGWWRLSLTFTTDAANAIRCRWFPYVGQIALTGDGTSGLYIWGAQLEVGDRPSSYIPTTTAQVTRAPDIPGRIVSNVPENDAPVWTAGTYTQGTKRIQGHRVYEVLAESTTDAPADGVAKTPPTWLDLGVTNPWRAFDEKIGTVTSNPEAIRFSIRADRTINALAFFGVDAGSIRVTVTDPSLGRVFEYEATPVSTDGIDNWYQYLFAPIELVEDFVVLEVPAGTYGTIDVSIDKPGGEAKLGALVLGQTSTLGVALYGTSIRLRDFSRKERDGFGNFVIQERDFSKVAEFDVAVDTANISAVQRTVAQYRAKPVVWIGEATYESTIIYGFCTDFGVSISGPTISDATFSVEGLN